MMKIIILSDSDSGGGAAIAAFRLHQALRKYDIQSFLIVREKKTIDPYVIGPNKLIDIYLSKLIIYVNRLFSKLYVKSKHTLFTYNYFSLKWVKKIITKIEPDVINIHWINENMLSYKDIEKIPCPIIFTLHDMNLFTGGCHYNSKCIKYLSVCNNCPELSMSKIFDFSSYLQFIKQKHLLNINKLIIFGPSNWICEEAKKSYILTNQTVINMPNPINVNKFFPIKSNKSIKKKILFGAINSLNDKRKGLEYLIEAINLLDPQLYCLEIFGNKNDNIKNIINEFEINFNGHLTNEEDLINLYRSCHVFVVPSIQENFSNAILESLSCGLPVVCFNIGGNSDMVIDRHNGYLAKPFDSIDITYGINWCVNNFEKLSINASQFVSDNFSEKIIYNRYLKVLNENLSIK